MEALVGLLELPKLAARAPAAAALDISMDLLSRVDELTGAEIDSLLNRILTEEGAS